MTQITKTEIEKKYPAIYRAIVKTGKTLYNGFENSCGYHDEHQLTIYFMNDTILYSQIGFLGKTRKLVEIGTNVNRRIYCVFSIGVY